MFLCICLFHQEDDFISDVNGDKTEWKVDEKLKKKQEELKSYLGTLLGRMAKYFDAHQAVDDIASDFMNSRLPPFKINSELLKKGNILHAIELQNQASETWICNFFRHLKTILRPGRLRMGRRIP